MNSNLKSDSQADRRMDNKFTFGYSSFYLNDYDKNNGNVFVSYNINKYLSIGLIGIYKYTFNDDFYNNDILFPNSASEVPSNFYSKSSTRDLLTLIFFKYYPFEFPFYFNLALGKKLNSIKNVETIIYNEDLKIYSKTQIIPKNSFLYGLGIGYEWQFSFNFKLGLELNKYLDSSKYKINREAYYSNDVTINNFTDLFSIDISTSIFPRNIDMVRIYTAICF